MKIGLNVLKLMSAYGIIGYVMDMMDLHIAGEDVEMDQMKFTVKVRLLSIDYLINTDSSHIFGFCYNTSINLKR